MISEKQKINLKSKNQKQINELLLFACRNGHLNIIKYLLTSTDLKEVVDIHAENDAALIISCSNGHLEVVKYLLTSTDLTDHANIHENFDGGLRYACMNGHLEIVKYLLTSPDLTEHANIHAQNGDEVLMIACRFWNLDIVKYLLTSPDLKEYANIHAQNDKTFKQACLDQEMIMLKYFIFDYKIKRTEDIENYLIQNNMQNIINLFDKRKLEEELQKTLVNSKHHPKIKL